MKCNKCGAELEEGALFCGSCGAKTETDEPRPTEPSTAEVQADVQAEAEASAEAVEKPVPETAAQADTNRQAPPEQSTAAEPEGKSVSLGIWVCRYLVTLIPCVGPIVYIILLFFWAFDRKYDETSRNWAKASLIIAGVCLVISIIFMFFIIASIISAGMLQSHHVPDLDDIFEGYGGGLPIYPY